MYLLQTSLPRQHHPVFPNVQIIMMYRWPIGLPYGSVINRLGIAIKTGFYENFLSLCGPFILFQNTLIRDCDKRMQLIFLCNQTDQNNILPKPETYEPLLE